MGERVAGVARVGIPQTQGAIVAHTCQRAAVAGKGEAGDRSGWVAVPAVADTLAEHLARGDLAQVDGAAVVAGGEGEAVRGEDNRDDQPVADADGTFEPAGGDVPQLHLAVTAPPGEELAVG
jgi:hypothetical protein